jgi:Amt family ammonium transporter
MEVELDTDPHNIPFVALGTGMLWFGWFGFNAGSALAADGVAAYAAINTEISASCALFAWMVIEWVHKGKPTLVGACVGAIAGLATITPAAGFVQPWAAMVIGLISAPWCYGLVELVKDKLVIDDALDVFAVHGMGGFLGTLCIGIFADKSVSGWGPEASGEQFGKQFAAAVGTAAYAYVVGFALVKIIGKFMQILPPQHALELGLDASIHGERAYKDTSNNGPALSKV